MKTKKVQKKVQKKSPKKAQEVRTEMANAQKKGNLEKEIINVKEEPYIDYGTVEKPNFDWLNFSALSKKDQDTIFAWIEAALIPGNEINFNISSYAFWQDCKVDTGIDLTYEQFIDFVTITGEFKHEIVANPYYNPKIDNGVKHFTISYINVSPMSPIFYGSWRFKKEG